jgi:predicted nucleic acid-binding protein
MTAYVDSSALLKRYLVEPGSSQVHALLASTDEVVISRINIVEVRRGLARIESAVERGIAKGIFDNDVRSCVIIECDAAVAEHAADIAEAHHVRSLDAIHIASAVRALGIGGTFITFDVRQSQAARAMGLQVIGV